MSQQPAKLSPEQQHALLADILRLATQLQAQGDPLLAGHYMHLRERVEMLLDLVEPVCWHKT